jgi:EF hand
MQQPACEAAARARVSPAFALCLAMAAIVGVDACSAHHGGRPSGRRLYSPTGEPLNGGPLGQPSCTDALSAWYERVDTNHDGMVDRDEFLADGRRQFAVMDLDQDGVITPAELAMYRAPYESETAPPAADAAEAAPPSEDLSGRKRRHGADHGRQQAGGGGGGSANDQPDPVMAADVGFRNQVSLRDFMAYATRQFAALDVDHRGRLAKPDILSLCHAPEGS